VEIIILHKMKVKIAIASNKNFEQLTLPIVLESLRLSGIENNLIHVFISGYDKREVIEREGITYYYLKQNSYEYSPLIDIVENELFSDYWFLMHDTCKTGPNFKELLYSNIDEILPIKVALTQKPAMSMGLYRYDYLLKVKSKLLSIKNEDYSESTLQEWKTWGVPNEDFILWMTEPTPLLPTVDHVMVFIGNENWYNTGSVRRTEYFPGFDIYKNKSNWGQTLPGNMVIRL
jgi:hypothetical protein